MKLALHILMIFCLDTLSAQNNIRQWSYFTEYGTLTLNISDTRIQGSLPEGNRTLEGILTDSVVKGKWKQRDGGGDIIIHFSSDFSTFKTRFNHADTKDSLNSIWKTDWTGMRAPEIITRKYKTPYGEMIFRFQGSQVEATYPWYNGKISGELAGNELTGIWLQSNRGFGNIKFKFSKDFSSFEGLYNDFNFHPEKWYKWNGKE